MAAEMIAGALVSTFVQITIDNLASRFVNIFRGNKSIKTQLSNLKVKLLALEVVAHDAEQKQFTDLPVRDWLLAAKGVMFDTEDLLEEIDHAVSKGQVEAESQSSTKKVWNSLKSSLVSFFKYEIESRMENLIENLENLVTQSHVLGLKKADDVGVGSLFDRKLPSTYLPNESVIYGRDDDKESVFNWLTSDISNNLSILSIVGMGGVGKTTLAQHVFKDRRVDEAEFDVKAWVCVSVEFDVFEVSRKILKAVTGSRDESLYTDLVQIRLKENLVGKKFLLVLDDVWNENLSNWREVRKPLLFGAQGSRIIVTTRSKEVAYTMLSKVHFLEQLQEDDSWELFAKHAFPNSECREIGKKIAKKCRGLPLALKTIGSLLYNKSSVSEWDTVFQNEIWELPKDRCNIVPALVLSYIHLPPHLKTCFAYCALFRKDYEFKKEDLIQIWMTENFLQHSKTPDETCQQYFNDLLSRSFFQGSGDAEELFVMHDLLNDLAKYVVGNIYFRCKHGQTNNIPLETRHFVFELDNFRSFYGFETLYKTERLRTFLPTSKRKLYLFYWFCKMSIDELFNKFKFLRILSLSGCNNLEELPDSIDNLEYLRSLDLSRTEIKILSEKICSLSYLQILKLNHCIYLKELPSNLHLLTTLCRLEFIFTKVRKVPPGLEKLKNLKVMMDTFIVDHRMESGIHQLGKLNNLYEHLDIRGLQDIENPEDALEADLKNKTHLVSLTLLWERNGNSIDSKKEEEVIENLQPSKNLKELAILNYGGNKFPNWLLDDSLPNLVSLVLHNCESCQHLPPLSLLPVLKELKIIDSPRLGSLKGAFGDSSSLESLEISKLDVECFPDESLLPPSLAKLTISYCGNLEKLDYKGLSQLSSLQSLALLFCPKLQCLPEQGLPQSISNLQIKGCPLLKQRCQRGGEDWEKIAHIQYLDTDTNWIERYKDLSIRELLYNPQPTLKADLKNKRMNQVLLSKRIENSIDSKKTEDVFENMQPSKTLKELSIFNYGENDVPNWLVKSSFWNMVSLELGQCKSCQSLPPFGLLPFLKKLVISGFDQIVSIDADFHGKNSSSFKSLETLYFSNMRQWEKWECKVVTGAYPCLQHLSISFCPKLKGQLPEQLVPLETLQITYCEQLEAFAPRALDLELRDCGKLQLDWATMKRLIMGGHNTEASLLEIVRSVTLEHLDISSSLESISDDCVSVRTFSLDCFPTLRTLNLSGFGNLQKVLQDHAHNHLQNLTIKKCPKFESLSEIMHMLSLKSLWIEDCPRLVSFPDGGLPSNLNDMRLNNCSRLVCSLKGAFGDRSCLKSLWIEGINAECFPGEGLLPLSLTSLTICGCPNLEKLDYKGLYQLSSLRRLTLVSCPNLQCLPEEGLPRSISYLCIGDCPLLEQRCQTEGGEDWEKISHIQNLNIL